MTGWSSHSVETNGIHLHYQRTGADRPPMVLAHGFTDMGLCWTLMTRKLEGHFDVIMRRCPTTDRLSAPSTLSSSLIWANCAII